MLNDDSVDANMNILNTFFHGINSDSRITAVHISLFMAIFCEWSRRSYVNPMPVERRQIMELAKISSTVTYFKRLKDLQDFGYIKYIPAKHRYVLSYIQF